MSSAEKIGIQSDIESKHLAEPRAFLTAGWRHRIENGSLEGEGYFAGDKSGFPVTLSLEPFMRSEVLDVSKELIEPDRKANTGWRRR